MFNVSSQATRPRLSASIYFKTKHDTHPEELPHDRHVFLGKSPAYPPLHPHCLLTLSPALIVLPSMILSFLTAPVQNPARSYSPDCRPSHQAQSILETWLGKLAPKHACLLTEGAMETSDKLELPCPAAGSKQKPSHKR